MKLAIEGHSTQGSEVIARLKMLGGMNTFNLNGSETNCYYYINDNNKIYHCLGIDPRNYIYYTLEEFLEKFPYKVGDKVQYKGAISCGSIFEVEEMRWEENTVKYTLCLFGCNYKRSTLPAEYLQPYKEETMEENKTPKTQADVDKYLQEHPVKNGMNVIDIEHCLETDGLKLPENIVINSKGIGSIQFIQWYEKPQYPKTYAECCDILGIEDGLWFTYEDIDYNRINPACISNYRRRRLDLYHNFERLIICRDAYWKIAGDEMGLDKPWKPDWNHNTEKYVIYPYQYLYSIDKENYRNTVLAFPTKEMRDAFYENFKDLIEQCKELL